MKDDQQTLVFNPTVFPYYPIHPDNRTHSRRDPEPAHPLSLSNSGSTNLLHPKIKKHRPTTLDALFPLLRYDALWTMMINGR